MEMVKILFLGVQICFDIFVIIYILKDMSKNMKNK